jgi:hypothetical protein
MFGTPTNITNIETICQYEDRQSRTRGAEDMSENTCTLNILKDKMRCPSYTRTNQPLKKILRELLRIRFMGESLQRKMQVKIMLPYKYQEAVWWNASISSLIRDVCIRWCGYFHILSALPWGKSPRYSLNTRLGRTGRTLKVLEETEMSFPIPE